MPPKGGGSSSPRKVERNDAYQAKQGSRASGTDASHRMSWELYNAIGAHMPGRPATNTAAVARAMGASDNLRIKSDYGNRVLDHRRDERIGSAFAAGDGLYEKSTALRAKQAYDAGMAGDSTMQARAERIGDMPVYTGAPGRPTLVKNL
jgi:hypothetical protein